MNNRADSFPISDPLLYVQGIGWRSGLSKPTTLPEVVEVELSLFLNRLPLPSMVALFLLPLLKIHLLQLLLPLLRQR